MSSRLSELDICFQMTEYIHGFYIFMVLSPDGCESYCIAFFSFRLSAPGPNIIFTDEIDAVRKEARRLAEKGINKIIALGHAGIELDKIIAEDIPEVDVVVGGHTHTFLYTGMNE